MGFEQLMAEPKPDATEYVVTLRLLPDASDPQGVRALRSALKVLLRKYGLRCIKVVPQHESEVTTC